MDLRETILKKYTLENCNAIVEWVGYSQKRFDELFNLFLEGDYRVTQRAAAPISYCVEAHPEFIDENYAGLIACLKRPGLHDAVKRNSIRLLQFVDIPEKFQGDVMNLCFQYLENPTEAVAIKAFSLTVLGNMARHYPEIIPEIKLLIEEQLPLQSAAFKSRAKVFLKQHQL